MKIQQLYLPILLLCIMAGTQTAHAQVKAGFKVGLNFSNVMLKDQSGQQAETESIPGINVGFTVDVPISTHLYFQPGLSYASKGFKQVNGPFEQSTNFKATASYVELPINLVYHHPIAKGAVLLGAGPYLAYGTGGKWTSDTDIFIGDIGMEGKGEVIFKEDVMDGEFGNYLYGKPLDYGLNFLVGYEFLSKLTLQLNAQVGLANLQPAIQGEASKGEIKNKGFGVSLGYKF